MEDEENINTAANALISMDDQNVLQIICRTMYTKPSLVDHVLRFAQHFASAEFAAVTQQQQALAQQVAAQQVAVSQAVVQQSSGAPEGALNASSERFVGVVKAFNTQQGFGFISCKETYALFGRDVFLHKFQQNGFEAGNLVSFVAQVNNKGHPQAFNLEAAPYESAGSDLQEELQRLNRVPQLVKPRPREERPATTESDGLAGLGQCLGVVKSFNPGKGYGFILCPDIRKKGYQSDVFVHASQLGTIDVGNTVQFMVFLNQKGQLHCKDLVLVDTAPADPSFFEVESNGNDDFSAKKRRVNDNIL